MKAERALIGLMVLALLIAGVSPLHGQPEVRAPRPWQVFLVRDLGAPERGRLVFVDLLTGDETITPVAGSRFTLTPDAVLFYDHDTDRVRLATADGSVRDHPFIQPQADTRRIDWIIAPDRDRIAWTMTSGSSTALTTITSVAGIDGRGRSVALTDGPRDGIRAFPVAFSGDLRTLYLDYQPDTIGDITPFRQYAGLFAVDVVTGATEALPEEPGCFCGAGINGDLFLRLTLAASRSGFDLIVYNLDGGGPGSGVGQTVPGLSLPEYTQGGDLLISPDGRRALYALARVRNFGTPNQTIQTIFVLVDLVNLAQTVLIEPINTFVRPVAWTEDNSAVLFTSPNRNGTWKLNIDENALRIVAEGGYLGTLMS
ncbi:MAG: hypothetical protein GYB67_10415 [Chloroflexi bacterium]|nr:hypothetical protein [Chloroflexota bacterium]